MINVLNELKFNKTKKVFFIIVNIFSHLALLYIYRVGSSRVEGNNPPGLRDFGCYISPGRTLVMGNDPYLDTLCATRYGTLSLFPFGLFDLIVPRQISVFLIQLISLIGIQYFVYIFCKSLDLSLYPAIALVVPWLSSVRENLVVAQATGLFMGLSGFVLKKYVLEKNSNISRANATLCGIILAFLVDIKPHSFGFFVLFIVIYSWNNQKNRSDLLLRFMFTWTVGHILIDLYVGKILEVNWIQRIFGLVSASKTSGLPESIAIWPLLDKFSIQNNSKNLISYFFLLFFLVCIVITAFMKKDMLSIYLIFLAPSFYVYYHHYDMVPIILLTILFYRIIPTYLFIALIEYVILPMQVKNIFNLILLVLLVLMFLVAVPRNNEIRMTQNVMAGTALYIFIQTLNSYMSDLVSLQTLFMTEFIFCFTLFAYHLMKNHFRLLSIPAN